MAGKKVLLARPHSFIVSEMLPFLTGAGYAPQRLGSLAKGAVARAVKSLHSYAEVYPIDNATLAQPGLGAENTFVVLTKDDFASAAALSIAEKILQKHFR